MMKVKVAFNANRINRVLKQIPLKVQFAAYDAGLRPAAKVVEKRSKELAPSSQKSGSRNKWSKSMAASRAGVKPLDQSIKVKVVRGGSREVPYAMVGPERPQGNVAHFVSPLKKNTREVVLWGRRTNRTAPKDDDFMRQAFDETRKQQERAFVRGTIKRVRKELESLKNG